jgi:glycosyltransferase involved in cell wall biosynthesis
VTTRAGDSGAETTRAVHVVVPGGVDDPTRPSGGNVYDRRLCDELVGLGWSVHEHAVPGRWPDPTAADRAALDRRLTSAPDGAVVVVDGLVGSCVPDVLVPHAARLRLALLVHLPLGVAVPGASGASPARVREQEQAALEVAAAVITPSEWARQWLLDSYGLSSAAVHVAVPGVGSGPLVAGSDDGGGLLSVAAVAPHKGHDVLLHALAATRDLPWRLTCVGALDVDPVFAARVAEQAAAAGLDGRVTFTGALTADDLAKAYADADLLVLATHAEAYGMVVTEALARGLPVVASDVGGVPEALGRTADGDRPGVLVPAGDPVALAGAVRTWLTDAGERGRRRAAAAERRRALRGWSDTAVQVATVLGRLDG